MPVTHIPEIGTENPVSELVPQTGTKIEHAGLTENDGHENDGPSSMA